MALTKLDKNLNIVSALDSEPNDVGGLTSEELKAKFDEGGKAIQEYINETLIPETEAAVEEVRGEIEGAVAGATEDLEAQLRGVVLGQIPNGTITEEKLDPEFVNSRYTKEETDELFAEVPAQIADAEKVGDIKTTIRNDIGDKWIPCNGGHIDTDKYPELGDMLPWGAAVDRTPNSQCLYPVLFGDGATIVFAGQYSSDYIQVFYSLDGLERAFSSSSETGGYYTIQSSYVEPRGLYCYNGVWCMVARSGNGHEVYYTTDVTNRNGWSKYILPSGEPFHLYCHNGTWVISGRTSTNSADSTACIWVSTNPTAGAESWTQYIVDEEVSSCAKQSVYHAGIWTVSGVTAVNRGTQSLQVYTTKNINGNTWAKNVIVSQSNYNYACYSYGLFAYDGVWAISSANAWSAHYTRLYYTQTPEGEWNYVDPTTPLGGTNSTRGKFPSTIYCHNGLWAYYECIDGSNSKDAYLRTTTDVSNASWDIYKLNSNQTPSYTFINGHGIITAGYGPSSTYTLCGYRMSKVTPNISVAGANTFIKAKM